ncbi:hypothetical protein BY458DRAFT_525713 [Sporodiniella umbellata]|nr:hypothetical protein BY458DRAFT_525713 [Sporodiniella umbellata]
MSFNNSFYYNQDYLFADTQCSQPRFDYPQSYASYDNTMDHHNNTMDNLLLNDPLFMNDEQTPLSTPQLYYSPILTEEYPDIPHPSWPAQQWVDPPVNYYMEEPQPAFQAPRKRKETPLEEKKYACPVCNHRSKRKHNMVEHMQTHNPNRPKSFSCQVCQRAFARKYDMKRHEKIHFRQ